MSVSEVLADDPDFPKASSFAPKMLLFSRNGKINTVFLLNTYVTVTFIYNTLYIILKGAVNARVRCRCAKYSDIKIASSW